MACGAKKCADKKSAPKGKVAKKENPKAKAKGGCKGKGC